MPTYLPRKQKINPKKSSIDVKRERMQRFLDIIEQKQEIKDIDLQFALKLGDGQYYTVKTAVKSRYPDFVEWNKKTKVWKSIPLDPGKLVSEQVISKHLAVLQTE